ncbi:MAG: hypothetical protein AB7O77_14675 [Phycisphaerales bacterium]
MKILAETAHRAELHTPESINRRIHRQTQRRIAALTGHPDRIRRRLAELDREWDVERWLETGSASLTISGLILGVAVNRRWLLLSATVQGFFLQHALQGWCPPLPLFRALGTRTQREIESERHALKALLAQSQDNTDDEP